MKNVFTALCLAAGIALLGGCNAEERRAELDLLQRNLPAGCKAIMPGTYAGRDVLVVVCDGRTSSTTLETIPSGKTSYAAFRVWVGPQVDRSERWL
jgi:hypothetical protein